MRKLLLLALLAASSAYAAETYLVHQFTTHVRVVLSTKMPCEASEGKGLKASAQRIDGKYVKGCWKVDPENKDNIRVDWVGTNDFYIERADRFTKVTE